MAVGPSSRQASDRPPWDTATYPAAEGPAVLAAAPDDKADWVEDTLQRLGGDEVRHIGYTARLMEQWCREGLTSTISDLYTRRLREFHQITIQQTEAAVQSYGRGHFPDLLEI